MENKYPGVTRWRLRDDVAFVEVQWSGKSPLTQSHPGEIDSPYLIDNIQEPDVSKKNVTLLTDLAGLIVRFIAMGVDTQKHLPDILLSEYEDMTPDAATGAINNVMQQLGELDYLLPREKRRLQTPADIGAVETTTIQPKPAINCDIGGYSFVRRAH